ncbi:MAG: type II toxin-antitoxin system RelE/ParE family toxin [Terriglobia bacterium]|jgi:mRNA interferase RelE/StbE
MPNGEEAGSSPTYRIFETRTFLADLANLGSVAQNRLQTKLRDHVYPILRQTPHSGLNIKRLKNLDPPTWRYRIGDWRFFYEIDEKQHIVFMLAADHRKEACR